MYSTLGSRALKRGAAMLTLEPRSSCLADMDIVLLIVMCRWEEICQVRQICVCVVIFPVLFLCCQDRTRFPPVCKVFGS